MKDWADLLADRMCRPSTYEIDGMPRSTESVVAGLLRETFGKVVDLAISLHDCKKADLNRSKLAALSAVIQLKVPGLGGFKMDEASSRCNFCANCKTIDRLRNKLLDGDEGIPVSVWLSFEEEFACTNPYVQMPTDTVGEQAFNAKVKELAEKKDTIFTMSFDTSKIGTLDNPLHFEADQILKALHVEGYDNEEIREIAQVAAYLATPDAGG